MRELSVILVNMIAAGTPILYALLGDMVSQRAGVISLSVEGSMLVGACIGFGVAYSTNSMILATLAAMLAGGLVGLIQAFLVIDRKTNKPVRCYLSEKPHLRDPRSVQTPADRQRAF